MMMLLMMLMMLLMMMMIFQLFMHGTSTVLTIVLQ